MYYKRITDLQPLGKPVVEGVWTNIKPIEVVNVDNTKYTVATSQTTYNYSSKANTKRAYPISEAPAEFMNGLVDAFNQQYWWNTNFGNTITYTNGTLQKIKNAQADEDDIYDDPSSDYYPKALWFEVLIAKDSNDKPVPVDSPNIAKYQSRRINAYNFLCDPKELGQDKASTEDEELNVSNYDKPFIKINNLYATNVSVNVAINNRINDLNSIISLFANIKNIDISSTTTINAITVTKAEDIDYLHGTNFYYPNTSILGTPEISVTNLYGSRGTFDTVDVSVVSTSTARIEIEDGATYKTLGAEVSATIGVLSIACYFKARESDNLLPGELVKFGRTVNDGQEEIIRAGIYNENDEANRPIGIVIADNVDVYAPNPEHPEIVETREDWGAGIILNRKPYYNYSPTDPGTGYTYKLVHLFGAAPMARIHGPTGVHEVSNTYSDSNLNGKHHKPGWESNGCCHGSSRPYPCRYDVGAGSYLYQSEVSAGILSIKRFINQSSNKPIAIALEATDNGSSILHDKGYFDVISRVPPEDQRSGGRQAMVFFDVNL